MGERVDITVRTEGFEGKLEKLKGVYNIASNSKLVEHLVESELRRQGF